MKMKNCFISFLSKKEGNFFYKARSMLDGELERMFVHDEGRNKTLKIYILYTCVYNLLVNFVDLKLQLKDFLSCGFQTEGLFLFLLMIGENSTSRYWIPILNLCIGWVFFCVANSVSAQEFFKRFSLVLWNPSHQRPFVLEMMPN